MLRTPTLDKLVELKLSGMIQALEEQLADSQYETLGFEERLGLMIDREMTTRENRRLKSRLKKAQLGQVACLEDVNYRHPRGLKRSTIQALATSQWIRDHLHVLITGPTGIGKSYLADALAHRACMDGYNVLRWRVPTLLRELAIARADGRYPQLMRTLTRAHLLLLD